MQGDTGRYSSEGRGDVDVEDEHAAVGAWEIQGDVGRCREMQGDTGRRARSCRRLRDTGRCREMQGDAGRCRETSTQLSAT